MPNARWLTLWLCSALLALSCTLGQAADPGDPVLFKGTPGAPEIDEPVIKVGGVPVTTVGASGDSYGPVLLATTDNITLTGEQSIDGVVTTADAVLVWRQSNAAQNGIYVSAPGAWTRRSDADVTGEFTGNKTVYVQQGSLHAARTFALANDAAVTVGTTAIVFAPQTPSWHVAPLQTLDNGGSIDCDAPSGQFPGVIALVVAVAPDTNIGPPAILPGVRPNQFCLLQGSDDLNTVDIFDGGNVILNEAGGLLSLGSRQASLLRWTGSAWQQVSQGGGPGGGAAAGLQANCDLDCVLRDLPEERPFIIAPAGEAGPQERIFSPDGNFYRVRYQGDGSLAGPEQITIEPNTCLSIAAAVGQPLAEVSVGTICNDGFSITPTGIFEEPEAGNIPLSPVPGLSANATDVQGGIAELAVRTQAWHLPWSAAGAIVDGTNCVAASTPVQINSGPRILPLTCSDAAGTIEFSFDTPARYDGLELNICFEINDAVAAANVWAASVIAQYRPVGATVNNTWSAASVGASVTLTNANANYFACALVTPDAAAPGIGRVFIKATIDNAGSLTGVNHSDTNGRVLGGYVSNQ